MSRPHDPPERQNEYFIEENGIAREVIQADICRYLGNQALVKPGVYKGVKGYYIRGYRNLTPEMIADLQADSARWRAEIAMRRDQGYSTQAQYDTSATHESRQRTGPTAYPPAAGQPYDTYPPPAHASYSSAQPAPYQPAYSQPTTYGAIPSTYASAGGSYPAHSQPPPASSPEYTYEGTAPYHAYNNDPRANPRYPGPGYENETEYPPAVTTSMGFPPSTLPDHRAPIVDGRYPPDSSYRSSGPPPARDRRAR
ncbi:transcription factor RfeG [Blastomyces dermatitidis ER-3]|uniref:Transcription factor RfeG n=3 Tax=Blastomyces TaxID=229219 RepID=A0A179U9M4_BLAGS|nr:transcription factor RfeG [Blastomyces gilchristii SLH14081]XP_045276084.1 transcription factor RfeG [Blastomyces dermatitidis ER-3]EGE81589.2 transcription factor RfeG [Blastomyces dermatitidis ATCC 18188]EQL31753.1 hypothetical protein BDFG_05981 [Blastomyces dermatitidis ATCC 26199]EEQ89093.2 transcription factor RfeG [Blastomyces dermatitidis ER-3]OAT04695.1 transcription factor RfeG [Blastomyces gilchristii SLH14081]